MPKLFAVYLGGRAPKANTELHDVVFAVGERIADTYEQLLDKWFGYPTGLHIDSWIELDVVDGWRVTLSKERVAGDQKLFFVNLGAYSPTLFTELHASGFYVAPSGAAALKKAKSELFIDGEIYPHKDDLYDIDDCIAIGSVSGFNVGLSKTDAVSKSRLSNDYYPLPDEVIADYIKRNR